MLGHRVNKILRVCFAGLFLLAIPALTRATDVKDDAGYFSVDAIEKANQTIREIEKKSGHEIQIETFATVPASKVDTVAKMDAKERGLFFERWIKDRAQESKANGTLILICKDPGHVETWSSRKLRDVGFTQTDHKHIKDAMLEGFRAKDYDGALQDTVAALGTAYSKVGSATTKPHTTANDRLNQGPAFPHRELPVRHAQSGWMPVIFIVGIVVAGIFLISLLSRLFGGGNRGYGPGPGGYGPGGGGYGQPGYGGGGGGGFMQNLAGGLFGAVAGNWLYNQFSGNSAHAQQYYPPSDQTSGGGFNDGSSQNDGGDFTGGGDFGGGGDDGGGGDFGGGGGGDFGGGGDSGGGGDFSGGGDF